MLRNNGIRRFAYESFGNVYREQENAFSVSMPGGTVFGSKIKGAKKDPHNTTYYESYANYKELVESAKYKEEFGSLDSLIKDKKNIITAMGDKWLFVNGYAFNLKDLKKMASKFDAPVSDVCFGVIDDIPGISRPDISACLFLESQTNVAYFFGTPFASEEVREIQEECFYRIMKKVFSTNDRVTNEAPVTSPKYGIEFSIRLDANIRATPKGSPSSMMPQIAILTCHEALERTVYSKDISDIYSSMFYDIKNGRDVTVEDAVSDAMTGKRVDIHKTWERIEGDTEEDMAESLKFYVDNLRMFVDMLYEEVADAGNRIIEIMKENPDIGYGDLYVKADLR